MLQVDPIIEKQIIDTENKRGAVNTKRGSKGQQYKINKNKSKYNKKVTKTHTNKNKRGGGAGVPKKNIKYSINCNNS